MKQKAWDHTKECMLQMYWLIDFLMKIIVKTWNSLIVNSEFSLSIFKKKASFLNTIFILMVY